MENLLLTKTQAAKQLQISIRMLEVLIAEKRIPVVRLGKLVRIDADELRRFVREQAKQRA